MTQHALWPELDYSTGRGSVDRLERYYTPDALARFCVGLLPWMGVQSAFEPHAGGGAFWRALEGVPNLHVGGMDADRTSWAAMVPGAPVGDFLSAQVDGQWDRVIGNPPFSNAEQHVDRGLEVAPEVAFLLPMSRLETQERCGWWQRAPLRHVWILSRRVWPGSRQIGFFWFDRAWDRDPTFSVVDQGEM